MTLSPLRARPRLAVEKERHRTNRKPAQTDALFRKNLAYQSRQWLLNLCLVRLIASRRGRPL